jgi:NhaA family Na+:H+ antiporter
MTIFFLAVSLEIRREMEDGALASARIAALPLIAAAGGILVPAGIYSLLNFDGAAGRGWAIPTATDIAFAVGVLTLLGNRVSLGLRAFLVALAILDDVAAIAIIAVFYSDNLQLGGALLFLAGVIASLYLRVSEVRANWGYLLLGMAIWSGLYVAGVHPTLAGVAVAFLVPVPGRLESALHKWAAFVIMPIFALVNAGVSLDGVSWRQGENASVAIGVFAGLVLGKPLGVLAATYVGVRCGWCALPRDVGWHGVALVGCLAGIGFTMAIFIAQVAFGEGALLQAAKLGVLASSIVAAGVSAIVAFRPASR